MKGKLTGLLVAVSLFWSTGLFAQLGIKAGVNMANEITSFSQQAIADGFSSKNLTGYQIGLVYQLMPKKSGLGVEIGALISQKGSTFSDTITVTDFIKQGYKELNYLEVPLNLRYRLKLGFVGIYAFGGVYGGYMLSSKVGDETNNTTQQQSLGTFSDRMDYGYDLGAGLELFSKIQFGASWSQGLKNTASATTGLPTPSNVNNSVFSVNLVYLF